MAERVRALLKKVHETEGGVTLQVGEQPTCDLKTASADEVMELLVKSRLP